LGTPEWRYNTSMGAEHMVVSMVCCHSGTTQVRYVMDIDMIVIEINCLNSLKQMPALICLKCMLEMSVKECFSLSLNKCLGYSDWCNLYEFQQVLNSSHLVCTDVSLSLWLSYEL
jgi:hypothetical protein